MRCRNPDCLRTMRSASVKTKETGLCGNCRKEIAKQNDKAGIVLKPKGRSKAKVSAIEKFEESLKNNPELKTFIDMFRYTVKPNVQSM